MVLMIVLCVVLNFLEFISLFFHFVHVPCYIYMFFSVCWRCEINIKKFCIVDNTPFFTEMTVKIQFAGMYFN